MDGTAAATAHIKRAKASKAGTSSGRTACPLSRSDFRASELAEDVYVNKVGTFGVSSAGYWWGRAGGAIMRTGHYFVGNHDAIWALLYSDDGKLTGRTDYPERGLLIFLLTIVLIKLPTSWHKVRGGQQVEWIGYALDLGRFEMGVSFARATWAARWLTDKSTEKTVRLGELREGLGRLQFLAGPVEYIRPFLGPLYAWASIGPRYARPRLPVMILLIMRYLAEELRGNHMMPCESRAEHLGEVFRLDAKAEGEKIVIGGWRVRGDGDTKQAEWFSLALTRATAPWAYARGDPFRTIASLELLGALVSLVVLVPVSERRGDASALISMTCSTDNQGNSFLLDRLLTTRYPLGVVLMELAHQMKIRRTLLRARWLPRLQNQEADDLTNDEFRHFDPKKRIKVEMADLEFRIMNSLFSVGDAYMAELEAARTAEKEKLARRKVRGGSAGVGRTKRRKRSPGMRETDPWG